MADNGLYALLDAMARRDQMAENRRNRELQKDQLLLALEEVRGNNALNREKIQIESEKTRAMIALEMAKLDTDRKRLALDIKTRETEMTMQLANLQMAKRSAEDAHERHTVELKSIENSELRAQAAEYRQNLEITNASIDRLQAQRTAAITEHGIALGTTLQMFGTGTDAATFKFNEFYQDVFEKYVKNMGLPRGTTAYSIAMLWAEDFLREYKAASDETLRQANELRKQRGLAPAVSVSELSEIEQNNALEKGYRDWLTGDSGPLVMAARGSYSEKDLREMIDKYGTNFNQAMLSRYTFGGRQLKLDRKINESFWLDTDPRVPGNREFTDAINHILRSFGPTVVESADKYTTTGTQLTNFNNNMSVLLRESAVESALLAQHNLNMKKGRGGLTKDQEEYISSNIRLQWHLAGLPIEQPAPAPAPGDGKEKKPGAGFNPGTAVSFLGLGYTGRFSREWVLYITDFYTQQAVDANAAADTVDAAAQNPQNAAAMTSNVTGAPNPYQPTPVPALVRGGGNPIIPNRQISHLQEAVGQKPIRSMWGSGFEPTRADSANAAFFENMRNIGQWVMDHRRTEKNPSWLKEVAYPAVGDFFSNLVGG